MRILPFCMLFLLSGQCRSAVPAMPPPLLDAKTSLFNLVEWHFQVDPENRGGENAWAAPGFDDTAWPTLLAKQTWQEQGFPAYHGVAWYRAKIQVPASWAGSRVLLQAEGIRDEYDVYLNGRFLRHFGSEALPTGLVPTQLEISRDLLFARTNVLALRVRDQGNGGGIWRRLQVRRVPPFAGVRGLLPRPVASDHPELVELYWNAWQAAWEKVSFGNGDNGFTPAYMEEGYDDLIYQWDSIFMSMYGRYGRRLFPAMSALDNFYSKQESDGYIQRVYSKTTGEKVMEPAHDYTLVNPPLFAWAEWDYFRISGDSSRLARVLPILERYDAWIDAHARSESVPGMFWQTGFDSGMDNMPRPNLERAGWVDMTLQEVLAAKYLAKIAHALGLRDRARHWGEIFRRRRDDVNRLAWNERDGIYYDIDPSLRPTLVRHIGAFWGLLSGAAGRDQAARLVEHLRDPREFYRPHLFPALSASDPGYSPTASYWRGGVWAPTNYMVIRGLKEFGYRGFARSAALNHLESMTKVYSSDLNLDQVDPNELDQPPHTIWECYNPENFVPCTRADAHYFGRQSFAGWTALGPISLLIEDVIGLDIRGAENRVVWHLSDDGTIGLENFDLGPGNLVSLVAEAADSRPRTIRVACLKRFRLEVRVGRYNYHFEVSPGRSQLKLAP